MSKTNTEKMAPETQTPEMANGMKLDVRVRPIAPMGNLLAFANVTIGGCFKIDGFRICSSEKGLYVNMPATQDKGGNWKDVCWPVTAEFRKQLRDEMLDDVLALENPLKYFADRWLMPVSDVFDVDMDIRENIAGIRDSQEYLCQREPAVSVLARLQNAAQEVRECPAAEKPVRDFGAR